ncbi:unnamed protein product [marine sediment metagenome]|uniref:DUF5131 family protein n=1 Tax=marine sediment metagenome TaxID=412755 RepID=X0ZZP9_9ZZZZ
MGDLFGDWVDPWREIVLRGEDGRVFFEGSLRDRIMMTIDQCPQHRFLFLTKNPKQLAKWGKFPDNCWVGVTATNMRMLADACYMLKRVEVKVKYISVEPFLDFNRTDDLLAWNIETALFEAGIGWVIIGGLTGKNKFYPPENWIQEIELACGKSRIPIFEKDNLRKVWYNYPRQEMPMEGNYANSRRTQKR